MKYLILFLLLVLGPVVISAANYLLGERRGNWQTADRSSAGLLPNVSERPDALIRVYAARTVRWRGIFAVHSWIVVKERGGFPGIELNLLGGVIGIDLRRPAIKLPALGRLGMQLSP